MNLHSGGIITTHTLILATCGIDYVILITNNTTVHIVYVLIVMWMLYLAVATLTAWLASKNTCLSVPKVKFSIEPKLVTMMQKVGVLLNICISL